MKLHVNWCEAMNSNIDSVASGQVRIKVTYAQTLLKHMKKIYVICLQLV